MLKCNTYDKVIYQLKNRAKYYVSRLISGQKKDPEGFQGNRYNQMKQVVSIWICMNHKKRKDNTIERYYFKNTNKRLTTNEVLSEQEESAEIIIVYPEENPVDVKSETNLSNFLNVLLQPNLLTKEEKFKILEEKYGILLVEEFKSEVEGMCNLSQGVWEGGIKEGKIIGREEGITIGKEEGMLQSTIHHVESLMEELPDLDVYKAMDLLKVEEGLRDKVVKELQE